MDVKAMGRLYNIIHNCKKATFLIEKKQLAKISFKEKVELQIHLVGCGMCRLFQQQSAIINVKLKQLFDERNLTELRLKDDFKKEMQHVINSSTDMPNG